MYKSHTDRVRFKKMLIQEGHFLGQLADSLFSHLHCFRWNWFTFLACNLYIGSQHICSVPCICGCLSHPPLKCNCIFQLGLNTFCVLLYQLATTSALPCISQNFYSNFCARSLTARYVIRRALFFCIWCTVHQGVQFRQFFYILRTITTTATTTRLKCMQFGEIREITRSPKTSEHFMTSTKYTRKVFLFKR